MTHVLTTVDFPSRKPVEWEMHGPTGSTRRLTVLAGTARPVFLRGLVLVDYLLNQVRELHR